MTAMRREIAEQPDVLARTLRDLEAVPVSTTPADRVLLAARGSSAHAAQHARFVLSALMGVEAHLLMPSVVSHWAPDLRLDDTLVIGASQSGRTSEIVEAIEWASRQGASTLGVANIAGSPLVRLADEAFVTPAGIEQAIPATKSQTSQAIALTGIAHAIAGRPLPNVREDIVAEATRLIGQEDRAAAIAALLAEARDILTVGRGSTMSAAAEIGLKIEETCLRPVRALSYADLRHGPFAMLSAASAVVIVAPSSGPLVAEFLRLIADVRATGASVVLIGGDAAMAETADLAIATGSPLPEEWAAPLQVIPGQLIALALALSAGLDPDRPPRLTKIGTTERMAS